MRRSSSMPSMLGIQMSSRTSAGFSRAISSITPAGSPVSSTRKPSSLRIPRSDDRIRSSSSTTSTVSFTTFLWTNRRAPGLSKRLGQNLGELLLFYRKLEHESTSPGRVVAHPDEAVMVGDDRGNDRQAQAGAALAGGKVGLENPRAHRRRD